MGGEGGEGSVQEHTDLCPKAFMITHNYSHPNCCRC